MGTSQGQSSGRRARTFSGSHYKKIWFTISRLGVCESSKMTIFSCYAANKINNQKCHFKKPNVVACWEVFSSLFCASVGVAHLCLAYTQQQWSHLAPCAASAGENCVQNRAFINETFWWKIGLGTESIFKKKTKPHTHTQDYFAALRLFPRGLNFLPQIIFLANDVVVPVCF